MPKSSCRSQSSRNSPAARPSGAHPTTSSTLWSQRSPKKRRATVATARGVREHCCGCARPPSVMHGMTTTT
eukprot:5190462-Pyramimonas_sp.AAC.1